MNSHAEQRYYGYNQGRNNFFPHNNDPISRTERMTGTEDEFSRFINLHSAFNYKSPNLPQDAQEKVHLVQHKETDKHGHVEVKIDDEAEDFIKQKHKAFELRNGKPLESDKKGPIRVWFGRQSETLENNGTCNQKLNNLPAGVM